MKEIICPKCGTVIKVDEADYAAIVHQVRTHEFDEEVARRMKELEKQLAAAETTEALKAERSTRTNCTHRIWLSRPKRRRWQP